jgi:hypothetical protein
MVNIGTLLQRKAHNRPLTVDGLVLSLDQLAKIIQVADEELRAHEGNCITRALPALCRQVLVLGTAQRYLSLEIMLDRCVRQIGSVGLRFGG